MKWWTKHGFHYAEMGIYRLRVNRDFSWEIQTAETGEVVKRSQSTQKTAHRAKTKCREALMEMLFN